MAGVRSGRQNQVGLLAADKSFHLAIQDRWLWFGGALQCVAREDGGKEVP